MEIVGVIALLASALSAIFGEGAAVRALIVSSLFGAAAAFNGPGIGTIQPSQVLLATFTVLVLINPAHRRRMLTAIQFPAPGFWLLVACAYGVLCAIFVPRILATAFVVNAIGSSVYGFAPGPIPFSPTSGNISQSIYFIGDTVCFLACSVLAATPRGFRAMATGLAAYCIGDVALALVDLATYYSGSQDLLAFIRNANYAIYIDTDETSSKRIIGSFTEASAFASATLGVFGFCARSWIEGVRPRLSLALALSAAALLALSTSSTAYVGLAVCLPLFYAGCIGRVLGGRAGSRDVAVLVILPLVLGCCLTAIMLHPPTRQALADFLDATILNKSASQSGIERGALNRSAMQNIVDTMGFGTGLGGVRTSSFVLAVLANLGVPGGAAYALFIGLTMTSGGAPVPDRAVTGIQAASRTACLWLLVSASTSGALVDLGLPFFVFAALACARADRRHGLRTAVAAGTRALVPARAGEFGAAP